MNALRGLIGGLRGYLAFCVTVAAAAPAIGIVPAVGLALALCVMLVVSTPVRPVAPGGTSFHSARVSRRPPTAHGEAGGVRGPARPTR